LSEHTTVFVYSSELEQYSYPPEHPFTTERARKARELITSMGLLSGRQQEVAPTAASIGVLRKFHTARYLQALKLAGQGKSDPEAIRMGIGSPDCPVFKGVYDYAVLATGGTINAVKMLLSGGADAAFNPSGGFHHAGPEQAAGFCYINDVTLACIELAEAGKKVLYIDVDVHHGDGVAYAFYDRSDVMTVSFHQNPRTLFPGTGFVDEIGSGKGKGYCINVPLPIATYDDIYMEAFKEIVPPLYGAFVPDVIVFELGADALAGDPLAQLNLTNNTYVEIINQLLKFDKPILMTGGGGYNIENTVRAWSLAWSILCGEDVKGDMNLAAGGIMLESTEWPGGLKDRTLVPTEQQKQSVVPVIKEVIAAIQEKVFPIHGL